MGEIWASMLFELYWNLVDEFGFSENLLDASQLKGNIVSIQLMLSALSLQPCQPDFLSARNAIILADSIRYDGIHTCALWKAFAKRGLGINASSDEPFINNFQLPAQCQKAS